MDLAGCIYKCVCACKTVIKNKSPWKKLRLEKDTT